MVVGLQMLVGCAVLSVPALVFETLQVNWSWQLFAAFTYTVFVPGLLATLVWFTLVSGIGPTKAAAFHFLNPFLGVAIAAVLLDERIGTGDAAGVAIIALGILAVQFSRQQSLSVR